MRYTNPRLLYFTLHLKPPSDTPLCHSTPTVEHPVSQRVCLEAFNTIATEKEHDGTVSARLSNTVLEANFIALALKTQALKMHRQFFVITFKCWFSVAVTRSG